jgi:hypothetical protein
MLRLGPRFLLVPLVSAAVALVIGLFDGAGCSCGAGRRNGTCSTNADCESGFACVQSRCTEVCLVSRDCHSMDHACANGVCVLVPNASCSTDSQCEPSACPTGPVWCCEGDCECQPTKRKGESCEKNGACVSLACKCADAGCTARVCANEGCAVCSYATQAGDCTSSLLEPGTQEPEECEGASACYADGCKLSLGADCTAGNDASCESGYCECTNADCTRRVCATSNCVCKYGEAGQCETNLDDLTQDPGDCDGNSQCVAGACVVKCTPDSTQPCGNCGVQTCQSNFTWGECTNEGACSPGAPRSQPCNCGLGSQTQTCRSDCTWPSTWGACSDGCEPTSLRSCGYCSTGTQTCRADCTWSDCSGGGECSPGAAQSCNCGLGTRTCEAGCTWGPCSDGCVPTLTRGCGPCGDATQTCQADCTWAPCNGGRSNDCSTSHNNADCCSNVCCDCPPCGWACKPGGISCANVCLGC